MLELITDVRLTKLRHKTDDVKLHTKQRHLYGDTFKTVRDFDAN